MVAKVDELKETVKRERINKTEALLSVSAKGKLTLASRRSPVTMTILCVHHDSTEFAF